MAPSSPTNVHTGFVGMESSSDRLLKKLRPEATIAKHRTISTIIVKERESSEEYGLPIDGGHNFSSFEELSQTTSNVDYVENDEDQEAVPLDEAATIGIAGFADEGQLQECEDFQADPFGGDVVDELQDMIDSCDEDCGTGEEEVEGAARDFEDGENLGWGEGDDAHFEDRASPLMENDHDFVAGQCDEGEGEHNPSVEDAAGHASPLAATGAFDFSEIAAPPPLE